MFIHASSSFHACLMTDVKCMAIREIQGKYTPSQKPQYECGVLCVLRYFNLEPK